MMININAFLFIVMMLLPFAGASQQECDSSNRIYRVQVKELGVQSEPRPMAFIVTSLIYKTEVTVTDTNGAWRRIGDCGWVHMSGITQKSLESSTGSVEEFSNIVNGIVSYLTTGVGNEKFNSEKMITPTNTTTLRR